MRYELLLEFWVSSFYWWYLLRTLTNRNMARFEITGRINNENACYYLRILIELVPRRKRKVKVRTNIAAQGIFCWRQTLPLICTETKLSVFGNKALYNTYGSMIFGITAHTYVCTCIYIYMYIRTYIHIYVRTYTIYTHTHTHTLHIPWNQSLECTYNVTWVTKDRLCTTLTLKVFFHIWWYSNLPSESLYAGHKILWVFQVDSFLRASASRP